MQKTDNIHIKFIVRILILSTLISGLSCSMQSRLNRQFKGMTKTELDEYFGQKGTIILLPPEKSYVVYTRTIILRNTPINKGVTTLDPMISPSVEKNRNLFFT